MIISTFIFILTIVSTTDPEAFDLREIKSTICTFIWTFFSFIITSDIAFRHHKRQSFEKEK